MLLRTPRFFIAICIILACPPAPPLRAARPDQAVAPERPELPFRLHRGVLILVEAELGSMGELTFILDTGTWRTIVDTRVARALRLPASPTQVFSFNGSIAAEEVVAPSIRFGPIGAAPLPLLAADLSGLGSAQGVRIDGIAGMDVLRGKCFTIDYATRRLFLGSGGRWDASTPFDARAPYPVVGVVVDGASFRVLVDTGAEGLFLDERAVPRAWHPRMRTLAEGSDLTGAAVRLRAMRADWIWLGLTSWRNRLVHVTPGAGLVPSFYDGVLGPLALGIRELQFDLERGVLSWRYAPDRSSR